jgi:hypothetical protein
MSFSEKLHQHLAICLYSLEIFIVTIIVIFLLSLLNYVDVSNKSIIKILDLIIPFTQFLYYYNCQATGYSFFIRLMGYKIVYKYRSKYVLPIFLYVFNYWKSIYLIIPFAIYETLYMFFFSIVNNLQSFNFLDYLINSISKNDLNIIFISYAGINLIYFFISFIFKNKIFDRFPTFNMLTSAIELEKINDAPEIRY